MSQTTNQVENKSETYLGQVRENFMDLRLNPYIKNKNDSKLMDINISYKLYTEILNKLIENGCGYFKTGSYEYRVDLIKNNGYNCYVYVSDTMYNYLVKLREKERIKYKEHTEREKEKLFKSLEADIPILTDKELEKRLNELY